MQVERVTEADLEDVLALNEASVPDVNSLSMVQLRWFAEHASYFSVVRIDGELAGFLIGLGPGLDYASPNYRYFCERHEVFGYVDRVAVAPAARRLGVGSQLYEDYATTLRGFAPVMTCEVNIRPSNDGSMTYHEQHGFRQVATQETENGSKEVALMEKHL